VKPISHTPIRVLVAEDDPLIRRSLIRAAKSRGVSVVGEATTGPEAVEQALALRPDAILMDVEMPGFDGLEATRQIQHLHPTPVVVVTAHDSPALLQSIAESGAGAHLLKPANPADLTSAITIAMARHADLVQLRDLLKQKECLVREVYHRVADQLGIAATLIHLQALRAPHPMTKDALLACESRVRAMGRVHAALQGAQTQTSIPLAPYLSGFVRELITGLRPDLNYQECLPTRTVLVDSSIAVSCGLLVHELVMNALKHAFRPSQPGTLRLTLALLASGRLQLAVADTGKGLPSQGSLDASTGLGLMIVDTLTKDLKGTLSVSTSSSGTTFSIEFNSPSLRPTP